MEKMLLKRNEKLNEFFDECEDCLSKNNMKYFNNKISYDNWISNNNKTYDKLIEKVKQLIIK